MTLEGKWGLEPDLHLVSKGDQGFSLSPGFSSVVILCVLLFVFVCKLRLGLSISAFPGLSLRGEASDVSRSMCLWSRQAVLSLCLGLGAALFVSICESWQMSMLHP